MVGGKTAHTKRLDEIVWFVMILCAMLTTDNSDRPMPKRNLRFSIAC